MIYLKIKFAHISKHFCGSEIFGAVSVRNDRHTIVLQVNSATYILSKILWGGNVIWLAVLYKTLTWNLRLAIWSEIIRVISIKRVRSTNSFESQVWFQTKIARYEVQLPLPKKKNFLVCTKFHWSSTEIVCNMLQDFPNDLFVFYIPSIWLVTLNEPWNLIGCFVSVWISLNITFVPTEF